MAPELTSRTGQGAMQDALAAITLAMPMAMPMAMQLTAVDGDRQAGGDESPACP